MSRFSNSLEDPISHKKKRSYGCNQDCRHASQRRAVKKSILLSSSPKREKTKAKKKKKEMGAMKSAIPAVTY